MPSDLEEWMKKILMKVSILDYDAGNLASVYNAFHTILKQA